MKRIKRLAPILLVTSALAASVYFSRNALYGAYSINLEEPISAQDIQDVHIVCIPKRLALHGADHDMKRIGAVGKKSTLTHACYFRFKRATSVANRIGKYECGIPRGVSRRIFKRSDIYDVSFSSLSQLPCGIRYYDIEKGNSLITPKIKNPAKYAVFKSNLWDAVQYFDEMRARDAGDIARLRTIEKSRAIREGQMMDEALRESLQD